MTVFVGEGSVMDYLFKLTVDAAQRGAHTEIEHLSILTDAISRDQAERIVLQIGGWKVIRSIAIGHAVHPERKQDQKYGVLGSFLRTIRYVSRGLFSYSKIGTDSIKLRRN